MSAYVNGRSGTVISLVGKSQESKESSKESVEEQIPRLPMIAAELEAYFVAARQLENAIFLEKAQTKKYRKELQDFQFKHSQFIAETEKEFKECMRREEILKSQLSESKKYEIQLRHQLEELRSQIRSLREQRSIEFENKLRDRALEEQKLKAQLEQCQRIERNLRDQMDRFMKRASQLDQEKSKAELERELVKTHLEAAKRREESLKASFQAWKARDQASLENLNRYKQEIHRLQVELERHRSEWGQISQLDRNAKLAMEEAYRAQRRAEELNEALSNEKRVRENLEDLVKKEKREKQLALSCLHTAEARLAKTTRELEDLREQQTKRYMDHSLELKF